MNAISPVVPVLDLMIGQIVLAIGGNRDEYRPVHSKLTHSSQPLDVAKAMFCQTGCDCLYLADIDSFAGAEPNWRAYNELLNAGFGLWIDADWNGQQRCEQVAERLDSCERVKVILSSETMGSVDQFAQLGLWLSVGIQPVFSLDKKGDLIITRPGELAATPPLELVQRAYDCGVRDMIVLDLGSVGTMAGVGDGENDVQPLLQEISHELPDVRLISGGGVRSADDAQQLLDAGCQHVLVASAIHDCRFTPDCVARLKPYRRGCVA